MTGNMAIYRQTWYWRGFLEFYIWIHHSRKGLRHADTNLSF